MGSTKYILTLTLVVFGFCAVAQNYPSQETFGKNRIQYRRFEWKILRTANFEIYHYQEGGALANLAALYAESDFDRITEVLGYTPYSRIKVFLYNSPQDLSQSNMGMASLGDLKDKDIALAKSRVEIAFAGDQISFKKQLIQEITTLFVYDMLYGGSLKDALQSSLLLSVPDWFMSGIAAYIAEGWTGEADDQFRNMIKDGFPRKPSFTTGREATIVGLSIWNYIAERYGRDNISNILNLTRIIRTEQTSIASTLGVSYTRFLKDWQDFYTNQDAYITQNYKVNAEDHLLDVPVNKQNSILKRTRLSNDNKWVAYSSIKQGKYSIDVIRLSDKKKINVTKGGYEITAKERNLQTPLVAWQRNNSLAVVIDDRGKLTLYIYNNFEDGKPTLKIEREIRNLNQIVDFDIADDGTFLVMSAEKNGQNDIYYFNVGRGATAQITNDLYDDLYPRFVGQSSQQFVFTSNRLKDTLGIDRGSYRTIKDKFGLFFHEGGYRATTVRRIIDSLGTPSRPLAFDDRAVYFLSDVKGITNLYRLDIDTKAVRELTNFSHNIQDFDLNLQSGSMLYLIYQNGFETIGFTPIFDVNQSLNSPIAPRLDPSKTSVKVPKKKNAPVLVQPLAVQPAPALATKLEPGEVDTENYEFDADILKTYENRAKKSINSTIAAMPSRIRRRENITVKGPFDYKGLFISNDTQSDVRVDPIRGFGFQQSITMNDLLEKHIVKAGAFVNFNFRNTDLWVEYSNLAHRIDYGMKVERSSIYVDDLSVTQKYRFNRVTFNASYPFSETSRFTISPFFAETRLLDVSSLSIPDDVSSYAGARAEFVLDNTHINGMNMIEGTRLKVRYDRYGGLKNSGDGFNRIAIDARHYQKIHRDIILALRFSFARSGGPSPKQSVLGGVENWIGKRQEFKGNGDALAVGSNPITNVVIDNRDLFFLEFAAPMRGFPINKLAGTNHMVFNAEVRMPLVKYFYRGPITSNFLRNFQLVAFTDVGTAWTGKSPFSRSNSLNTTILKEDSWSATVTTFRNPFLVGYGLGARTMLFGFYAKLDYAWGLDNNASTKAIPHLSLGYDF